MITIYELKNFSKLLNIPQINIIEKDWILSFILNSIYGSKLLKRNLIFKGGTALRKVWLENYRFSEDLDFTLRDISIKKEELKNEFEYVCKEISDHGIIIQNIELTQTLNDSKGNAFLIKLPYRAILPVSSILPKINIDITTYEKILTKPVKKNLIHQYSDKDLLKNKIMSYSIEELLAEKMRTILQRYYPRDIYDVYCIISNANLDLKIIKNVFIEKCNYKNVKFENYRDFFEQKKLENVKKSWKNSLSHLIRDLPDFDTVISKLRKYLQEITD